MSRPLAALLTISVLAGVACSSSSTGGSGGTVAGTTAPAEAPTAPDPASATPVEPSTTPAAPGTGTIDPANFVGVVDNPWYPLVPGTTWVYEGTRDGEPQRDEVTVTSETKEILGVPCVVVQDTATDDRGNPIEVTQDWFTQDVDGNVWYFGEDTKELENGKVVSTEGSWESGVDGAVPGIVMPAHPEVTDSFRQEYYAGHAEDMFWLLDMDQQVSVPFGDFSGVMLTMEWTRLEPKVIDQKYYVKGVGLVLEASATGPNERAELVGRTGP